MQTPRSSTKRRIFQQLNQSMNENIPPNVRLIHEKVSQQSISMGEKFRNLEDPLGFIHNDHLQNLVRNTKQTARKLKQGMQETCQLSKNMYKNMISSDEGKHQIFENFRQKVTLLSKQQINEKEIIKTQTKLKNRKVVNDPMLILVRHLKAREINEKIKNSRGPQLYRHQREQVITTQVQPQQRQLTFDHVKLIGTPQFYKTCKKVEFYDILRKVDQEPSYVPSQVFDIHKNYFIDKKMLNIDLKMIESSCQWGERSKNIFYDFDKNLKYWKHASKQNPVEQKEQQLKDQLKEENILPNFLKFNKKQIDINNILNFASGKIDVLQLKGYFSLKKQHERKQLQEKQDENLQQKYEALKRQYDHAHELRSKAKAQGIPLKYTETQCQTIKLMQEKDFDEYFCQDLNSLFVNLDKLNKVRQRALTDRLKRDKMVITKNICLQIKENLFKLLTMVLKGEKFYPRQTINGRNYGPYFTYNDLFDVNNRQEVENRILELIYDKIDEFQCEEVDNIKKTDLIRIYVEEREKNMKILEMIETAINGVNPAK